MEIKKVFTKYDKPYKKIYVPYFKNITSRNFEDLFYPQELNPDFFILRPKKVEKLLEGVKIITYGYRRKDKNSGK